VNTPHPELEELAALADTDGASDDPELSEHVAGCPRCRADLAALRDVRSTLRSLPPVTMPDDVAQRLESALRDAATAQPVAAPAAAVSVLPSGGSGRRGGRGAGRGAGRGVGRRGSGSGLPNFSAAAAVTVFLVIALGVGLGIGLSNSGGSSNKGSSTAAGDASEAGSVVMASGTDYTQDSIRNQVAGLVLAKVPDAHTQYKGLTTFAAQSGAGANSAPQPASSAAGGSARSEPPKAAAAGKPTSSSAPALAPRTAFSGPLGDPARLQACVQALLNQPGTALLVDYAYYAGKPATIIVLQDPADPSTLDIYVESGTADCANDLTLVTYLHNAS
jgi:hypothetical protein